MLLLAAQPRRQRKARGTGSHAVKYLQENVGLLEAIQYTHPAPRPPTHTFLSFCLFTFPTSFFLTPWLHVTQILILRAVLRCKILLSKDMMPCF